MKMKKTLAFILGMTLAMPCTTTAAFAAEADDAEAEMNELVEAEEGDETEEVRHLYAAPPELLPDDVSKDAEDVDLPSKVDLRTKGLVTSIKSQGEFGTCWAHALLAGFETDMIKDDPHIDLSERCLATYVASSEYGDKGNSLYTGSNPGIALGLISNWIGVVSESLGPYSEEYIPELSRKKIQEQTELHLEDVHIYDFYDPMTGTIIENDEQFQAKMKEVKKAVCDGHGVYLSLNFNTNAALNYSTYALYNTEEIARMRENPHAVLIVGYDDDYAVENFYEPPEDKGAWLVKNSWGADDGDNGYYWVSYFDKSIDEMEYYDVVPAELHDDLYSYDDYGVAGRFGISDEGDECTYISNIYTAEKNGFITDVMTNCCVADDAYEITIYTGLTDDSVPTSGEAHTATTGVMDHVGYQTIKLSEPVHINEGEKFAVVEKITGEKDYHIACEYAYCYHYDSVGYSFSENQRNYSDVLVTEDRILETFGEKQSFFSADGREWTDLYDSYDYDSLYLTGNLCLRAMTCDEGAVHFSSYSDELAPGYELSLSCSDGKDIYYSIDGGDYSLYTAPITFTKDMTVSAYVEGDEENVYSRHYAEKHAEITNMLVDMGYNHYYADLSSNTEIVVYSYIDEFSLYPMLTGVLTDGENVTGSYEKLTYQCGFKPFTITLTAEEEGLKPTKYTFNVHKECMDSFEKGTWKPSYEKAWYYFNEDGKTGYCLDRVTNEKNEFSYTIANNSMTMKFKDSERKCDISLNEHTARMMWEDGTEDDMYRFSDAEERPCYTNPEVSEIATDYYTKVTGKAPKSVEVGFAENCYLTVTITSETGEITTYNVYEQNLVGQDQDGNVVDLNKIPVDTGITTLKPGIWSMNTYGNISDYVYVDPNGKDMTFISVCDDNAYKGEYFIKNGQLTRTIEGFTTNYIATIWEDRATLEDFTGMVTELEYISDDTPETFDFLNDCEISALVSNYYEVTACISKPFNQIVRSVDNTVTVYTTFDDYYNDELIDKIYYQIDRITGECTDKEGNKIDIYNPVLENGYRFKRGLWKNDTYFFDHADGYYWLGNEDEISVFYDAFTGERKEITYNAVDGNGIAYFDGVKKPFTYFEDEEGIHFTWYLDEGLTGNEDMRFVKEIEKEDFTFYPLTELGNMAKNDYEEANKTRAYIFGLYINPYNQAIIILHDYSRPYEEINYVIDPTTGKGINADGDEVDLPQTGVNTMKYMVMVIGAFMLVGIGGVLVIKSGSRQKKEEV